MRLLFAAVLLILAIEAHATKKCYRTRHACKALDGVGLNKDDVCDGQEVSHKAFVRKPHLCKCCFSNIDCGSTGCPDGFFQVPGSDRCYQFFDDEVRTWDEAEQKCQAEGSVLAMTDNNEMALRNYIVDNFYGTSGNMPTWLGAKSDGANVVWEQTGTSIPNDSSLWGIGAFPGPNRCLVLITNQYGPQYNPTRPFFITPCTEQRNTLCEKVQN